MSNNERSSGALPSFAFATFGRLKDKDNGTGLKESHFQCVDCKRHRWFTCQGKLPDGPNEDVSNLCRGCQDYDPSENNENVVQSGLAKRSRATEPELPRKMTKITFRTSQITDQEVEDSGSHGSNTAVEDTAVQDTAVEDLVREVEDRAAEIPSSHTQATAVEEPEQEANEEDDSALAMYIDEVNKRHKAAEDTCQRYLDNNGKLAIKVSDLQKEVKTLQGAKDKLTQEKSLVDEEVKTLQGAKEKLIQEKSLVDEQVKQLQLSLSEVDESLKKAQEKNKEYRKRENLAKDFIKKRNASEQAWESTHQAEELDG
ncbi:uncharacterized protein AB675_7710 [Cyphellophora attinorum]|uniref:Uncharacterized protein n=1 Tax=Cyphellophora attinorum TaxID=1664694 RepID=A0A0N1NZA9_9EURO|nr:uncharacterized protein AB675_7710 [Phialophora attinorum]KPI40257.1 hypothetical protein AB675_7710 [Phialophora attinorum]